MPLNPLDIETHGFVIARDAVSHSVVRQILDVFSAMPPSHAHRNILDLPTVRGFATGEEAMRFVRPVLWSGAIPVRGILFDKLPEANWKVAWHQDLSIAVKERHEVAGYGPWSVKDGVPHVQPSPSVLENMLTLRLHLDDCDESNGPLRLLPGSHNRGILGAEQIRQLRDTIPETTATLPAGGVLLMRPLLLHASSPASNPRHRRVLHIEYAAGPLPAPLRWHAA